KLLIFIHLNHFALEYFSYLFHKVFIARLLRGGHTVQIHVVQNGDTLFSIADVYDTSTTMITEANQLPTPNLVVGQALVIPIVGQYYFVQPGDSLFTIAQQFQISTEALARINQISLNETLSVGLRIYIPPLA